MKFDRDIFKRNGSGGNNHLDSILLGDCLDIIPTLPKEVFRAAVTSPPYAMQRQKHYGSIPEAKYPAWTVKWMEALAPSLTPDASVLIVIRSHIRDGQVSDYVLRTRLAVREAGWIEPEELIWLKSDAPPLGHKWRPRRTWEHVLWFSRTTKPFMNLRTCGNPNGLYGWNGTTKLCDLGVIEKQQNRNITSAPSRITDVLSVPLGTMSHSNKGIMHPAMFPSKLADILIQTFSKPGDCIIDPFMGSGTTAFSAKNLGRHYCGIEAKEEYVAMCHERLRDNPQSQTK